MEPRIAITREPIPETVWVGVGKGRKSPIRTKIESLNKGECLVLDYSDYNLPHKHLVKKGKNIRSTIQWIKKANPGTDFTTRFDTFNGVFRIWRTA